MDLNKILMGLRGALVDVLPCVIDDEAVTVNIFFTAFFYVWCMKGSSTTRDCFLAGYASSRATFDRSLVSFAKLLD